MDHTNSHNNVTPSYKGKPNGRPVPENKAGDKIVGILVNSNGRLQLKPCDKKKKFTVFDIDPANLNNGKEGDVVVVECLPRPSAQTVLQQVKVTRVLGHKNSPGILSLISILERGLKDEFSKAATDEAKKLPVPDLNGRDDLRNIPLVTIDGATSRDFDDAVFAEKTADGGFHLVVAIADVAWYVRPGSALDKEAYERGNSTYLPDRAFPMLPEELSNGLCSLKPHEDRACLAFHLYIDKDGNMTGQKIVRGLMRSAARLTYEQVQAAKDGSPDSTTRPLMNNVIKPLYDAYAALRKAREARGALELNFAEYKINVNDKGEAVGVEKEQRPDSCRVIEEFMILANVAAATALESKKAPCVYRVHDRPRATNGSSELRAYLKDTGLSLPEDGIKNASDFRVILEKAAQMPNGPEIVKAIQKLQLKAVYDTVNLGHFGLALEKYAHFTSPIRRYADLLVHRSLIDAFNMGADGLSAEQKKNLQEMAAHISETEVQSTKAERSAKDRFSAAYFSSCVGKTFTGRITSAIGGGLFVKLDGFGADGLLPVSQLPGDFYDIDLAKKTATGRNHGRVFKVGDKIEVVIKEADKFTGSITFTVANDNSRAPKKPWTGPKSNTPRP